MYERAEQVGGRVAFEEQGGYRIDRGPTIVLLPEMLLDILEEGGLPRGSLELLRCDPLYRVHFRSGRVLTKFAGPQSRKRRLTGCIPEKVRASCGLWKICHTCIQRAGLRFWREAIRTGANFSARPMCR